MWIPFSIVGGTAVSALVYRLIGRRRRRTDESETGSAALNETHGPVDMAYPPGSRPAGPGAEGMNVPAAGRIAPGPPSRDVAERT